MIKSCENCIRFNPQPQNITMPTVCSSCEDMSLFVPVSRQEADEDRIDVVGRNGNTGDHYAHVMSVPEIPIETGRFDGTTFVKNPPPTTDNTAPGFLRRASEIMEERGKQYDQPGGERSMGKTVAMFNACTGRDLSEADGWLLMECLKNVRQWQRPAFHQDSADDGVAYSALKAEALARG